WGNGSRKVLLVHGWESHAGDFYNFVHHLTATDFSVFAMDAPAHGWSGGSTTNIIEYKEFLKEMFLLHGNFDYIITHSLGGMAVGFLLQEMPHVAPNKLVFISPPSTLTDVIRDYSNLLWIPKKNQEYLRQQIMQLSGRALDEFDMAYLSRFLDPKKVMIVHDVKDRVVPIKYAESIHNAIPDALFLVTENFGHNKTMRDPLVINKVLEFIRREGNQF
ncbi:MAG TPA: alpha/beta fold hydrolase, partial [Cytophagaceae bacterium]